MDPNCGPTPWTQTVDLICGPNLWTQIVDLICGLDLWIRSVGYILTHGSGSPQLRLPDPQVTPRPNFIFNSYLRPSPQRRKIRSTLAQILEFLFRPRFSSQFFCLQSVSNRTIPLAKCWRTKRNPNARAKNEEQ